MNTTEVAELLDTNERAVLYLIRTGKLRARFKFHTGYAITRGDLRNYLDNKSSWPKVRNTLIDALVSN